MLPTDSEERKNIPIYSGVIQYFPDALAAVAALSKKGNDQHNPGSPLHWDRSKSGDELDALCRHIIDEDWDAVAWRALAHLQKTIEEEDPNAELRAELTADIKGRSISVEELTSTDTLYTNGWLETSGPVEDLAPKPGTITWKEDW
jgi:hypothetical protein